MTWIRVAELRENDGGAGPHLDIDICSLLDGGTFTPMDGRAKPCPGGKTWGVWWHASASRAYATHATSSPCQLEVVRESSRIAGIFVCDGLANADGTEWIDIRDGRFEFVLSTEPVTPK